MGDKIAPLAAVWWLKNIQMYTCIVMIHKSKMTSERFDWQGVKLSTCLRVGTNRLSYRFLQFGIVNANLMFFESLLAINTNFNSKS